MKRESKGIYLNPETREILRVTDSEPDPGDGWIKISGDHRLGLLAARRKIKKQGLVKDPTCVEWFGMRAGSAEAEEAISALICQFKRNSEESEEKAGRQSGLLGRLTARLKSVGGGSRGDAGQPSWAVPVRIPVRSRNAEDARELLGR